MLLPGPTRTPMPKGQLLAVYAIKLMLPVSSFQVLPFINEMVGRAVGRPVNEVGYYSGLVTTSYSLAQTVAVYPWSRTSDVIGRVPVITAGMLGLAISSLLFGSSETLTTIIVTRFMIGACTGIMGALHSVVAELVDSSDYSTAFPLYDVVAAVGFIVGPLIGGNLSNPARYPALDFAYLRAHPYFLPCAVVALFSFAAAGLAIFQLRETNSRRRNIGGRSSDYVAIVPSQHEQSPLPLLSAKELLAIPSLRAVCMLSGAIGMIATGFNSTVVLVAYTPVEFNGLGLSPAQISFALMCNGMIALALKLTLPFILRRTTTLAVFRITLLAWLPTFAGLALLPALARLTGSPSVPLWIGLGVVLFLSRVGCLTFSLILILVPEHTPDSSAYGTANGIAELIQSIGSAISPAILSAFFAASVTHNLLGGYLWAVVAIATCAACTRLVHKVEEEQPTGSSRRD